MNEPDVTLTDYGLALECAIFAWLLYRRRAVSTDRWAVVFFAAISLASLAGGSVHGFFPVESGFGHRFFWSLSMLAIGLTALAGWNFGARLAFSPSAARWVGLLASLQYAAYAGIVLLLEDAFWVAILDYLPAALFLLLAFGLSARRRRLRRAWLGVAGMGLTFVSAAIQQLGIALHPVYFNHNALYHLIQALALALIFIACWDLSRREGGAYADTT